MRRSSTSSRDVRDEFVAVWRDGSARGRRVSPRGRSLRTCSPRLPGRNRSMRGQPALPRPSRCRARRRRRACARPRRRRGGRLRSPTRARCGAGSRRSSRCRCCRGWCRRSGWRPGSARRQGRFAPRSRQSRAKHRIAHATGGDAHDHVAAAQRRSVTFGGVRANIMRTSVQVAAMLLRQSLSLSALMSEGRDPGRPRWLGSTRRFPCHGLRRPPRRRAPIARLAATPVRRRLPDMHASPRWRILRGRRSWTGSRFQASRMDRGTSASSLESRGGTSKHRGSPYTVPAVSANRSLSVALLPSKQRRNPCAPLPTLARGRRVADRLAG